MTEKLLVKSTQYLAIFCMLGSFLVATPMVQAACPDSIVECWCDNGQLTCTHQLPSCTKVTEVHSEMPGAASCLVPSPSPSATNTIIAGIGGGPVASSTPAVVAAQSDNSAGELPKTGLPVASFALLGLIPLGYKLRSFRSKVGDSASTIWAKKQLNQE